MGDKKGGRSLPVYLVHKRSLTNAVIPPSREVVRGQQRFEVIEGRMGPYLYSGLYREFRKGFGVVVLLTIHLVVGVE